MIINFEDYLLEELLNESMVNEKINLEKIKNFVGKVADKGKLALHLIKKFNETENLLAKKHLATILVILFFSNMALKNSVWSDVSGHSVNKAAIEIAKEYNNKTLDIKKIKAIATPILVSKDTKLIKPKIENLPSIDITKAKTSLSTKLFIKEHEKLRLKAYDIGDGHITVGYGHAKPAKLSQYAVGDSITLKKAEQLFAIDIKSAEDGVKRMLRDWEKQKLNIKVTQSMFDSMVSMAYNMGVTGFVNSKFLDDLKNKDYMAAAEKIKTTRITAKVKNKKGKWETVQMPGLVDRRMTEYTLFVKDIS